MAKVNTWGVWVSCGVVLLLAHSTLADFQSDLNECQGPLQNLTTCLDFVGGHAKAPTSECCSNVKHVRKANPKCLCVLIKDSNNPQLSLPVNQTLALELPNLCKLDAKLSDCPALLHISPSSPDAKIFESGGSSASPSSSVGSASKSTPVKATPDASKSGSFGLSLEPRIGLTAFGMLAAALL